MDKIKEEFLKQKQDSYLTNSTKDAWKYQLRFGISLMSQVVKHKKDVEGNEMTDKQINGALSIIGRLETQLDILNKEE